MRAETDTASLLIAPLGPGPAEDSARFGRKAAVLSRLAGLGMPVKPGFAVSETGVAQLSDEGPEALAAEAVN